MKFALQTRLDNVAYEGLLPSYARSRFPFRECHSIYLPGGHEWNTRRLIFAQMQRGSLCIDI